MTVRPPSPPSNKRANEQTNKRAQLLPISSSSDTEVITILKENRIGLTVEEARKICTFLGRDPTLTEASIWGIQGSEHCSYKSSRRFLKNFVTTGKHVILGPGEDSGIVAITDGPPGKRWGLVISHESHNKPSQVVPYEGAATGIGGVVRDVVCMGARVIGGMDMLRLGDLKSEETRTIAREVARGIAGYGNPLGIPNLGGDTVFDAAYNKQCLVNAIAVGIVREDEIIHSIVPEEAAAIGYDIIVVGKPTDRSGFGGASFASASLDEKKKDQNTGAVQEPNPFLERHILASTYALFDWLCASGNLHRVSFKDHGAGGNVCASVEQVAGRGYGAEISLDAVHTALNDLPPEVIACAETQERLCWIVHPDLTEHILKHYNEHWDLPSVAEGARASRIGKVTADGIYRLRHKGVIVCEARSVDITSGLQYTRPTERRLLESHEPTIQCSKGTITVSGKSFTLSEVFTAMLQHPNGASTEPILRHYDKTVIGNSIVEAGEADAGVIMPLQDLSSHIHEGCHPGWEDLPEIDRYVGVALAADGWGRYGRIDPYWQGANATVECMRNVAAVGAIPRALTDCLNYGNPEIPKHLSALEQGVLGIADAAKGVQVDGEPVPVISGNVSLYNSKPDGSCIDPTAVVCCIGVMEDARNALPGIVQSPDSLLFTIGHLQDECGGSLYYQVLEDLLQSPRDSMLGTRVPRPDFAEVSREISLVLQASSMGLLRSCHDVSQGGVLLAAFEMTTPRRGTGGTIGCQIDLSHWDVRLRSDAILFSESGGFIVEIAKSDERKLIDLCHAQHVHCTRLGSTDSSTRLRVIDGEEALLDESLEILRNHWSNGLLKALYNHDQ